MRWVHKQGEAGGDESSTDVPQQNERRLNVLLNGLLILLLTASWALYLFIFHSFEVMNEIILELMLMMVLITSLLHLRSSPYIVMKD